LLYRAVRCFVSFSPLRKQQQASQHPQHVPNFFALLRSAKARKSRLGLEKGCYFKPGKGGLQDLQRLGTA
jgi:hypothetical protein